MTHRRQISNGMKFSPTKLHGVFVIDIESIEDKRGFFARTWDEEVTAANGCAMRTVQCNISFNQKAGTLRGMHYQDEPYAEPKIVRCTQGSLYDVALDLRPDSRTFKQWTSFELSAENRRMLYIPEGCAHGFQTLEDITEVFYQMGEYFHPECARGVRFNDPAFNITWPEAARIISEKDLSYPLWTP